MGGDLDLFVVTAPGLEAIAAAEVEALGLRATPTAGGVEIVGGQEAVYRANLVLRTGSRVLVRVARFRARSFIELERHARRIDWSRFLADGERVAVRVTSRKSRLYHARGIAERFGRWIGEATGATPAEAASESAAPGIEEEEAGSGDATLVVVRALRDEFQVSIDSSGELLHRRGYRQEVAKAPLRETIAAAMLLASEWDRGSPLVDPMCGSGTIPIEAALLARDIAPGLAMAEREPRRYAFERWPSFDPGVWGAVVDEARKRIRAGAGVEIVGSDRDAGAIEAARNNAARAGVEGDVRFEVAALTSASIPGDRGTLLTNAPYGVRVGEMRGLRDLYSALGRTADRLPGWRVGLLAADQDLVRRTGIAMEEALRTRNGGIPVAMWLGGAT